MYDVSSEYIEKLLSNSDLERRIRGKLGNIDFTEADILSGSFKISAQCVKGADISLGGVYITQLSLSFLKPFADNIPRNSWRNRVITGTIDLKLDNLGNWESVPFGVYTIDEATHGAASVDVKAYDNMSKFDKNTAITTTSGQLYDFLNLACTNCGVTLGMTQEEVEALPNGTELLGLYPSSDITKWRDYISWLAVTAGGFATIDRTGALVIRNFKNTASPDLTISQYFRASGGGISDYITYYTGISVTNIATDDTNYYNNIPDNGLTMNIGSNPFVQYGTDTVKTRQRRAILNALSNFRYSPFTMSFGFDIALDLGDIIDFTGGIAGGHTYGCIMAINYVYFGLTQVKGYGNNPALFGAQSKTDKDISGLASRQNKERLTTLVYTNATEYEIGNEDWTKIAEIKAVVATEQNIQIHGVVKADYASDTTAYLRYKINGEVQPFIHVMQFPKGIDTITFFYPYAIEANEVTAISVEMMSTSDGSIEVQDVWMSIQAVGIVSLDWDGTIDAQDTYSFPIHGHVHVEYEEGNITIIDMIPQSIVIDDEYELIIHGKMDSEYEDTMRVVLESNVYDVASSDKEYIIGSSDGEFALQSSR